MIECQTTYVAAAASARRAGAAQAIERASPHLDDGTIGIRTAIPLPDLFSNAANFAPDLVTRRQFRTVEAGAYDTRDAMHGSTTGGDSAHCRVGAGV